MEITQEQINTRQQELERSGYRLISEKVSAIRVGKTLDEFLDGNRQSEFAVIPNNIPGQFPIDFILEICLFVSNHQNKELAEQTP